MGQILFDGARHTVAQANIDAKRITTKSGNEKRGALSSLAQFSQSLGNQRKLDAAGDQIDNITENLGRNLDAAAYGKLGQRVGAAEELGAAAASAAAAGVGGSSIESYNQTLRLSQEMAEEQGDRTVNSENIAAGRAKGQTIQSAVGTLGNDVDAANLDFTQLVDDHKMSTLTKVVGGAAAAAATYFGGPQAGEAVLNLMSADQQASNGNFAGASRSIGSALNEGQAGWNTYRAGADDDHTGAAWGQSAFQSAKKIYSSIHIH